MAALQHAYEQVGKIRLVNQRNTIRNKSEIQNFKIGRYLGKQAKPMRPNSDGELSSDRDYP